MLSLVHLIFKAGDKCMRQNACLCMGDLQALPAEPAPLALRFVFLITL